MEIMKQTIIIPSLMPNEKLLQLIRGLRSEGFERIIVVDDGSSAECAAVFQGAAALGCRVLRHEKNRGKGAAIKTALADIRAHGCAEGVITADADGQHLSGDIKRVALAMAQRPEALVLGVRDFSAGSLPWRSLLGNRITCAFFRMTNSVACPDTQTGLRGIPSSLLPLALSEQGERYEYEMNFLMDAVHHAPIECVPIETVYEDNNRASHFRPLVDSCRVYGRFLRFAAASIFGTVVEYLLFYLLMRLLSLPHAQAIFIATAAARVGSASVNYLLNRYWSFNSRRRMGRQALRYCLLAVCQLLCSAALVSLISLSIIPIMAAKLIVDTVLFFISFRIQKNWVFRREVDGSGE